MREVRIAVIVSVDMRWIKLINIRYLLWLIRTGWGKLLICLQLPKEFTYSGISIKYNSIVPIFKKCSSLVFWSHSQLLPFSSSLSKRGKFWPGFLYWLLFFGLLGLAMGPHHYLSMPRRGKWREKYVKRIDSHFQIDADFLLLILDYDGFLINKFSLCSQDIVWRLWPKFQSSISVQHSFRRLPCSRR